MKTTNYLAGLAAITMTFTGVAAPISAYDYFLLGTL